MNYHSKAPIPDHVYKRYNKILRALKVSSIVINGDQHNQYHYSLYYPP